MSFQTKVETPFVQTHFRKFAHFTKFTKIYRFTVSRFTRFAAEWWGVYVYGWAWSFFALPEHRRIGKEMMVQSGCLSTSSDGDPLEVNGEWKNLGDTKQRRLRTIGGASETLGTVVKELFGALEATYGTSYERVKAPLAQIREVYDKDDIKKTVDACYTVHGKKLGSRFDQHQVKLGLVVSLERETFDMLSHVVPVTLVRFNGLLGKQSFKEIAETDKLVNLLNMFMRVVESIQDSSCHDLVWLTTVASVTRLASYIRTELPTKRVCSQPLERGGRSFGGL